MMYRILLVDDEPIILSGIKFLIDWAAHNCEIVGTARNGKQALDSVAQLNPDIVICDINMPVYSGLDVLKTLSEDDTSPLQPPVFIMLTNMEEFEMAREAMRYRAVDYLLKTQLDAETLEKSLDNAINECVKRGKLAQVERTDDFLTGSRTYNIQSAIKNLILCKKNDIPYEITQNLLSYNVLDNYCIIQLMLDFSELPTLAQFTKTEKSNLFEWEKDVIIKLAENMRIGFVVLDPDDTNQSLVLFCWNIQTTAFSETVLRFFQKIVTASQNITQTKLSLLYTNLYNGEDSVCELVADIKCVREYYFHSGAREVFSAQLTPQEYVNFDIKNICNKLVMELRSKNIEKSVVLVDEVISLINEAPRRSKDVISACIDIYSTSCTVLQPMLTEDGINDFWQDTSGQLIFIKSISTRSQAIDYINHFKKQIVLLLEQLTSAKSDVMERAKQYIHENADKRIMLQDVASFVNISPSYLSAQFKKEHKLNFIDYINQVKMQRACELIKEGKYRIYEISYMLSFENAYYFTKVFKKNTGFTPSEYAAKYAGRQK